MSHEQAVQLLSEIRALCAADSFLSGLEVSFGRVSDVADLRSNVELGFRERASHETVWLMVVSTQWMRRVSEMVERPEGVSSGRRAYYPGCLLVVVAETNAQTVCEAIRLVRSTSEPSEDPEVSGA